MARAWLIRHGESAANAGERTSDPARIPLTARGHTQAAHVAAAFVEAPTRIVTSSYLRTRETAAPTIARFGLPVEEWEVHEFTYLSPARCAATTAIDRRPRVSAYWEQAEPGLVDGEGAESFASFVDRVHAFLGRLRSAGRDERIAVFTHGQFIRGVAWALAARATVIDRGAMQEFRAFALEEPVENGSLLEIDLL